MESVVLVVKCSYMRICQEFSKMEYSSITNEHTDMTATARI